MSVALWPNHAKGDFEPMFADQTTIAPSPAVTDVIIADNALVADPVTADRLYKDWQKAQELKKKRTSSGFCSCVIYAKALTGYSQSVGYARNWPKNSLVPTVGGVVITNESRVGHVGVITAIDGDNITIIEANYSICRKTIRILNTSNPVILGYWNKTNE